MYTNPFNQQASARFRDSLACPLGGLKGKIAPSVMPTLTVGAFLFQNFTNHVTYAIINLTVHNVYGVRRQGRGVRSHVTDYIAR